MYDNKRFYSISINWIYFYLYLFFKTSTYFRNFQGIAESGIIYGWIDVQLIDHHFDDKNRIKTKKRVE
jgi:hypothetical protein